MKTFSLSLSLTTERNHSIFKIEADDLIELLTKFTLIVAQISRQLSAEELFRLRNEVNDDDIPF
jgi:hypothetical protein